MLLLLLIATSLVIFLNFVLKLRITEDISYMGKKIFMISHSFLQSQLEIKLITREINLLLKKIVTINLKM